MLKTNIVRKVSDIPRDAWEKIFPDVLESYDFLKTVDESGFSQFTFYYLMVYEGMLPVGATTCFTMRFPLDMTVQGPAKNVLGAVKRIFPDILSPKVLMCGIPMGQGRIGVAGRPPEVLRALEEGLETVARQEKAPLIIWKDFTLQYETWLAPLLKRGYRRIESLPSTDMDIRFTSFEEYLMSLGPVSRAGVRRKLKKIEAGPKIELEIADALSGSALDEAHALYLQTLRKHEEISMEEVPRQFFANIARNMPGKTKFFLWRMEGRMVGFAFCLFSQGHFIDYYLGFDYSVAYEHNLYLVRLRDLMQWCIAQGGIKKYEMGVTGYEAKRRMGFEYIRLFFYLKHRNPLLNFFFRIFVPCFEPKRFDPVFKDMEKSRGVAH